MPSHAPLHTRFASLEHKEGEEDETRVAVRRRRQASLQLRVRTIQAKGKARKGPDVLKPRWYEAKSVAVRGQQRAGVGAV
jgi:hypothetical protein